MVGREKPVDGKKVIKPQDLVRMYENLVQSLHEVTSLAGLEEDESLKQATESKVNFYRAFRSYYIALAFILAQKWPEAMSIFQKAKNLVAAVSCLASFIHSATEPPPVGGSRSLPLA